MLCDNSKYAFKLAKKKKKKEWCNIWHNCCWKNKVRAGEWLRSNPADLTGGSTVHFCQKDNRLFFLSAHSKQELENLLVAKIRVWALILFTQIHWNFWLSVLSDPAIMSNIHSLTRFTSAARCVHLSTNNHCH